MSWKTKEQSKKVDPAILQTGLLVNIEIKGEMKPCQITGFSEETGEWQLREDRPQYNAELHYRKAEDIYFIW